jgi:hypothetical protein
LMDIADLNLKTFDQAEEQIRSALTDTNPWKRYWGLVVCSTFGAKANAFVPLIQSVFNDDTENLVRIRAWEYLALHTDILNNDTIVAILKNARSETEANLMLNSLALIKHFKPQTKFDFTKEIFSPEWYDQPNDLVNRRMDYLMEH